MASVEDLVRQACSDLPPSCTQRVLQSLADHCVIFEPDLREVSDGQFAQMEVPVGIANRIKRFLGIGREVPQAKGPVSSHASKGAPSKPQILGRVRILEDKYGCRKGQTFYVSGRRDGKKPADACLVLETAGSTQNVSVPCNQEGRGWKWIFKGEHDTSTSSSSLFPYVRVCDDFLRDVAASLKEKEVPRDRPCTEDDIVRIPVACLRWTHGRINSKLQFAHGEQGGQSVLKLFDELLRGVQTPDTIDEPLDVVVQESEDEVHLFSISNRRLLPLLMLQSAQRSSTVYARCIIRPADAKFDDACQTSSVGLQIAPGNGESCHLGRPLFDHGRAAMKDIEEVAARHPEFVALDRLRLRQSGRAPSECSLTIAPPGQQEIEPPRSRRRIDVAAIALLVSPPASQNKPKRELWLFRDAAWSKASLPFTHRDQHIRLDRPNPQNPRHIQSHWELTPCAACAAGSEIVLATDDEVHRIVIGLGKSVPNRATDQAVPNKLSATSRIAVLRSNKLLTLTSQGSPNRPGEAALLAHLLNFSSRSWEPFRLVTADSESKKQQSTIQTDADVRRWAPAQQLPLARDYDVVEHIGEYVYLGSRKEQGDLWLQRICVRTGEIEVYRNGDRQQFSRSCCQAFGQWRQVHLQGGRERPACQFSDCQVTSTYLSEVMSAVFLVFDNHLHTLRLRVKNSEILDFDLTQLRAYFQSYPAYPDQAYRSHIDPYHMDSNIPLPKLTGKQCTQIDLELISLSKPELPSQKIGTLQDNQTGVLFSEYGRDDTHTWCNIHRAISQIACSNFVLAIALADRHDKEAVYVFMLSVDDSARFQAGWRISQGGTVSDLEASALELPAAFPCGLIRTGNVNFVGGQSVALLAASEASAQFDARAETWSSAPLVPSPALLNGSSTFVVPSHRKGLIWPVVDFRMLLPCGGQPLLGRRGLRQEFLSRCSQFLT